MTFPQAIKTIVFKCLYPALAVVGVIHVLAQAVHALV